MVVRNADQGQAPRPAGRRVRDDARERIAVMAFSLAVSAGVALLLHLLPPVHDTAIHPVSNQGTR